MNDEATCIYVYMYVFTERGPIIGHGYHILRCFSPVKQIYKFLLCIKILIVFPSRITKPEMIHRVTEYFKLLI